MSYLISFLLVFGVLEKYENETTQYILEYKEVAIAEMQRTGIPASIKLAQAIIESNKGLSNLAQESNNHFGIKCKSYWKGETFYHKDDDRNEEGKLIKSCFRAYPRVFDSYIDHSNFIKNSPGYWWLFNIEKTNYRRWAEGIQLNGYATDPNYAKKMIRIIEQYELNKYDNL